MARRAAPVALAVGLLSLILLGSLARVRPFDRDEGFYAMAADRVATGAHPWRDFIYPQGPLYPYLLSVFGADMGDLRWVPVLFGSLTAALLVLVVARRQGVAVAGIAGALFLTCEYIAVWVPTVKTYAPTNFFSLASLVVLLSGNGRPGMTRSLLAGLLLGTAGLIRIPALALLLPLSAGAWLAGRDRPSIWADIAAFGAMSIATFAIGCLLTGASTGDMLVNAVRPHANPVSDGWLQRRGILVTWLVHPQVLVLLALAMASLVQSCRSRNSATPEWVASLLAAALLTTGYLLASPAWDQYLVFAVPFWLLAGTPILTTISFRRLRSGSLGLLLAGAWGYGAVQGCRPAMTSPYEYQYWFQQPRVARVHEVLRRVCEPGATVASIWPGYVAGTGLEPLRGLESTVALDLAGRLTPEDAPRAPVMSLAGMVAELTAGRPRAVVLTIEDVANYNLSPDNFPSYRIAYGDSFLVVLQR